MADIDVTTSRSHRTTAHRGSYILERGVWRATCQACGWHTNDPQRRQAAALFRMHIHDSRAIDLDALAADPAASEAEDRAAVKGV